MLFMVLYQPVFYLQGPERGLKKHTVADIKRFVIPICWDKFPDSDAQSGHWTCAVYDVPTNSIIHYDPMVGLAGVGFWVRFCFFRCLVAFWICFGCSLKARCQTTCYYKIS